MNASGAAHNSSQVRAVIICNYNATYVMPNAIGTRRFSFAAVATNISNEFIDRNDRYYFDCNVRRRFDFR